MSGAEIVARFSGSCVGVMLGGRVSQSGMSVICGLYDFIHTNKKCSSPVYTIYQKFYWEIADVVAER